MRLYLSLVLGVAAGAAAGADLAVREVVLYKHGVGYFERSGQVSAGDPARLEFRAEEKNDGLKSLTIEDKGVGKVSGLRYDSSEPLAQKLAEFPFQLGSQQPLSAVLDQLKGARVELKMGAQTVTGAIVSGRLIPGDEKRPQQEQVTLLDDSGDLRNVDLTAVAGVRFTDPKLQAQFKDYLAALVNSRAKEKRILYIDSTGSQPREIVASYMIPTPVWKSSYRLIFGTGAQPTLEGWAIVDNTTGEDWSNIQLALVSGRPISFISRLYEPRYVQRPVAELPDDSAARPVIYAGAIAEEKDAAANKTTAFRRMGGPASPAPMAMAAGALRQEMQSSVAATATGRDLGELFEYRIATPVTVRKNESATLPFVQQKIASRKLLVYSDPSSEHPTDAAELTNATGKTLDGGPITVFDGGAYGGEALMETLKSGDKRLISYAVDLGTRITTQFDSKADIVREIHFRRGVLTAPTAAAETKTYTVRNVDQKSKTLIIEHPVRTDYDLLDPKPAEKTASAYRFEVPLGAGATVKFPVHEERVYDNTQSISSLTPDVLAVYVSNKSLGDSSRRQLEQVVNLKNQIAAADEARKTADTGIEIIARNEERIRQNIASLNKVSGQQQQVQNYAKELADQESQVAALRDQSAAAQKRRDQLQSDMNAAIGKMEF